MRLTIEAFAAKRRTDQDSMEKDLFPLVREAVDRFPAQGWYDDLLREATRAYLSVFHNEGGKGDPRPSGAEFAAQLREALDKTKDPDHNSVDRISVWLATAILNAGTQSAAATDEEFLLMEWVTMHDRDVREAHRFAAGQQRPPGEPFDMGRSQMRYPGDPSAPIELWINCRCTLAPVLADEATDFSRGSDGVIAAAPVDQEANTVVVALPKVDDPVHGIGDEDKHVTLLWLGKGQEFDRQPVHDAVAAVAEMMTPTFPAEVSGTATLGPDHAKVWLVESGLIQAIRDVLLTDDGVAGPFETAEQTHPHFVPHVTATYGDTPEGMDALNEITFDRLAVWDGEDRTEYPFPGDEMTDTTTEAPTEAPVAASGPIPWHGVLAPEGVWSGDKRRFAEGSLRFRDLPLPLTWQKQSAEGHGGSVVVGRIDTIERVDGMMHGTGVFLDTPEADEVIGLVAEFGRFGVSVDADDGEFDFDEGDEDGVTFTSARICSAALVPIPAFAEAFVSLGERPFPPKGDAPTGDMPECDPDDPDCHEEQKEKAPPFSVLNSTIIPFVSDKPWSDFTAADYTDQQWKAACVMHVCDGMEKSCHKLPIKEPGGALNRNGVHAAAGRYNQTEGPPEAKARAKSALRGAYKQLGEEPPEVLKAALVLPEHFGRGPGWITNPVETKRIHDYWTKPGQPGYAKIGWGSSGDFNRCRVQVGEEIGENSPDKLRFLNQICAQWHHDALGIWPGRPVAGDTVAFADGAPAPAISMVASGGWCAPSDWFKDPELAGLTPVTVTDEGRVFGHLAGWSTCHVGFEDVCVAPPISESNYAYFLTGETVTADGTRVAVGNITLGGGHAGPSLRPKAALAHYDSTSSVVADVTAGEDAHGIWLAGAVRPGLSDETLAALRASAPSGDWRRIGGSMELIAALAVNVQGFPVPRVGVHDAVQVGLVAAGGVVPGPEPQTVFQDLVGQVEKELWQRNARRAKMAELAARVNGA